MKNAERTASGSLFVKASLPSSRVLRFEDARVGMQVWTGKGGHLTRHEITSVQRARGCESGVVVKVSPAIRLGTLDTQYDLHWFVRTQGEAALEFYWNLT